MKNKWYLMDHKKPEDEQIVIVICHDDDIDSASSHIMFIGEYNKSKFIVTAFDSEGLYELHLPVICWQPLPNSPFHSTDS